MVRTSFECDTCERTVSVDVTTRTNTFGAIDDNQWATLCCPHCGTRLETEFVG